MTNDGFYGGDFFFTVRWVNISQKTGENRMEMKGKLGKSQGSSLVAMPRIFLGPIFFGSAYLGDGIVICVCI